MGHRRWSSRIVTQVVALSFCGLPALGVPPETPQSRSEGGENLLRELQALVAKGAPAEWQVGVAILDHEGTAVATLKGDAPLSPASNQKILVVGAALALLGPDFQYETTLSSREAPAGGAVGDLVVRGGGDPNISARFHNGDPTSIFRRWAAELKVAGLTRIAGDLVVDDSFFDAVRFLPGWKRNQAASWYSAEVGALNFNDNCVEIAVFPTTPGQPARVELRPATAYVGIENDCKTAAGGTSKPILHRNPGSNTIEIRRAISNRTKEFVGAVTVEDPGLYFGSVLAEVLKEEGIAVGGRVVRATLAEKLGTNPVILLRHRSPLAEDLAVINKRSQNLHAEVLLKTLGAQVEKEGSVAAGGRAIAAFLRKAGIASGGLIVADGSGLSAENRVSAATLAGVLGWIQKQPFSVKYIESLAIAGKDGTLKDRFKGRRSAGKICGKTGSIAGVSALSGYATNGERRWVFAIIVNGLRGGRHYSSDITAARRLQEEIAEMVQSSIP